MCRVVAIFIIQEDNCKRFEIMEVHEIHRYPQFMDQCCDLINMEWPRSKTARLRRLEMSCDNFPTCLVLVHSHEVLGHSRLSLLPSLPLGCLIESEMFTYAESSDTDDQAAQ